MAYTRVAVKLKKDTELHRLFRIGSADLKEKPSEDDNRTAV